MENRRDCYETYLSRSEYTALRDAEFDDPGVKFIVRMCNCVGDDVFRVYPDAAGLVEIANALGHIPWNYHIVVADMLRAAGWTDTGRNRPTPVAGDGATAAAGDVAGDTRPAPEHDGYATNLGEGVCGASMAVSSSTTIALVASLKY